MEIKFKRTLEKVAARDESGWDYKYNVDGESVDETTFNKERKRKCLYSEGKSDYSGSGSVIGSDFPLILEVTTIIQYVPLPFYERN